jgi:hypothetical protein
MAKGQQRSGREAKKPKQNKPKVSAAAAPVFPTKGQPPAKKK